MKAGMFLSNEWSECEENKNKQKQNNQDGANTCDDS